jgi:hypothetical protein
MERGPSRLESGVSSSKDTIEVRFEKAPEPEKKPELEKRCNETRFRKTPEGALIAVCSINPQDGKTCEHQENQVLILTNLGYQPSYQKPQTAGMFVCSKQYQKTEEKKQSPEWDSNKAYKINSYDNDVGWKNPLDGDK